MGKVFGGVNYYTQDDNTVKAQCDTNLGQRDGYGDNKKGALKALKKVLREGGFEVPKGF